MTTEVKRDAAGCDIRVGDTVLYSKSEGADLYRGRVIKLTELQVHIDNAGRWPAVVKRYPGQVVVIG
jgi:hypothetical protein